MRNAYGVFQGGIIMTEEKTYSQEGPHTEAPAGLPVERANVEEQAENICRWAAARAAVVVVAPFVGTVALIANEVYMIKRIGDLYGQKLSESVILGFIGSLGAAVIGGTLATLIPYSPTKILIATGLTYGLGKAAHEWIKAGKPDDISVFKEVFEEKRQAVKDGLQKIITQHPDKDKPLGDEDANFKEKEE